MLESCRRSAMVCALLLWLFALSAQAGVREVEPGTVPELARNEALLLVTVDTDAPLDAVRIAREGMNFDAKSLLKLDKGRSARLFVVPAGRYRWASVAVQLSSLLRFVAVRGSEESSFEVRPGRLNYPGDLVYRARTDWWGTVHVSNRGLLAMDWMQARHPETFRRYPFEYTGMYPDPFPAMYREAIADGAPAPDRSLPPPAPGRLPLSIDELWRPGRLQMVELGPSGDLLAEVVTYKREDAWRWGIDLVDLAAAKVVRLYDSPKPVSRLDWAGDRSLIMSIGASHEPDALIVVHMRDAPDGRKYDTVVVPRIGLLRKVLRDEPGHILFESEDRNGDLVVHKLDIRDQAALRKYRFPRGDRLNRGVDRDERWYVDGRGRLRMAIAVDKKGDRVLMHGLDGEFRQVLTLDDENDFEPLALSADGELVYGIAEKDRGQRDLVEFDPAAGKVTRTLFSRPGVDVQYPLFDDAGRLIGVAYYRDGLLVNDYFEQTDAGIARRLGKAFPNQSALILQRDKASRHFVVAVGGSDRPTSVYVFDRETSRAELVSETRPWLAGRRFAPSHALRVKSRDGFEIEAYLTLPEAAAGGAKRPLVVFPHGGPIGVRDDRFFDPEVQFLASLGYAVLQVNFRGSEGFGTAFREAGVGSYGSAIEDDIDAALAAALAQYPLDEKRMCAMGASYGGYSAMVSAIRWPGRFRCAISISGVSDRALVFTASDSTRTAEGRKLLEERIGDPKTDMEKIQTYSPLYRYRELALPLMLVHGGEDLRVEYEHTRRLLRMLNLADRPPVLIELKEEGHGIEDEANNKRVWEGIAGFLRAHLGDPLAAN